MTRVLRLLETLAIGGGSLFPITHTRGDLRGAVALAIFCGLAGCQDRVAEPKAAKVMDNKIITLADRNSGYSAGPEQWKEFLACWSRAELERHRDLLRETPDMPHLPLLGKSSVDSPHQSIDDISASTDKLEKSLGVPLPRSYRDFLLAHNPPVLRPQAVAWGTTLLGMYAPSQVGRVRLLDPEGAKLAERYPIEKPDQEYFVYGARQDDAHARTRYIPDAIVVGRYGSSSYELILLYPQVRTADGEMEAAIHYHSGEFRAPSFAELMRQLSILETKAVDHVPPYPQTMLKGTCADKLPMVNVWWE